MKILQYSSRALSTPFGTPSAVRGWCDALAGVGADVTLATDAAAEVVASPRLARIVRLPHRFARMSGGRAKIPLGLSRLIEASDVLVLHGGWRAANVRAATLARNARVPYVLTPHGRYDPHMIDRQRRYRAAWWHAFERPMVAGAAAVHLFFEDEPTVVPAHVPLVIAPNGIEPPISTSWDGGSSGSLLWLGRFDPEHKGLDLLIESINLIPAESRPTIELYGHDWLGGKSRVVRHIRELQVDAWVRPHDPIVGRDKWDALVVSKGFVYPSRWDACPLAPAEAASIGVPCVVTPFPLGRFLAARGVASLSDGTPEDLAQKILGLARSTSTTPTDGAAIMREFFSWPTLARSWLEQVSATIGRPGVPHSP